MAAASESPQDTRRIVLLGKSGVGKSSLANTIFGEDVFTVVCSPNAETKNCQAETRSVNERNITLIDTPGLLDLDRCEEEQRTEILRCTTEFGPGLHAFLIVFKMEKFNSVVNDISRKICDYFPDEVFKYAAVVFTHGDQLRDGMTIEKSVRQNTYMRDLVQKCGNRCHIVDNVRWKSNPGGYRSNQVQVAKLLNTIDNIVKENNGGCYKGDRRIVLLGKTGVGKSSTSNTIFGETVFKTDDSPNAGTSECANVTRSVNGIITTLIDTPGFFDLGMSKKKLRDEMAKCIIQCAPGPHVFLILLKVEKHIPHKVIDKIQEIFSEEVFKYVVVVFTHGDQLPKEMEIKAFVQENEGLSDLVKKCDNRCHVIDNKYWQNNEQGVYRSNQFQVAELLKTIDKIVKENDRGYYTHNRMNKKNGLSCNLI